MTNYQHQIAVLIAETLEKLQDLNPDLYALRYTQLYSNHDDWTITKLHQLEQDLINESHKATN